MPFRIRAVEPSRFPDGSLFGIEKQIILWLEDEQSKADGPGDGTQWCVRLTADEARKIIPDIFDAYAMVMQKAASELAAGGCRNCRNKRLVDGEPCPVCVPRGERRLRDVLMLRPKRRAT